MDERREMREGRGENTGVRSQESEFKPFVGWTWIEDMRERIEIVI